MRFEYQHRVFQRNFKLTKIKRCLDKNTRLLVYKQTILPILEYIDALLYIIPKYKHEKLQRQQNSILRKCLDIVHAIDISVEDLHREAHLLNLNTRREIHLMNLMYKYQNIKEWTNIPAKNTRRADGITFKTEQPLLNVYGNSPYYLGARKLEELSINLHNAPAKTVFQDMYVKNNGYVA